MAAGAAAAAAARTATRATSTAGNVAAVREVTHKVPKVKVRRPKGGQQATITAVTVLVGTGVLKSIVVDKKTMPDRSFWFNTAIIGFVLSLTTEIQPKIGRPLAYLVIIAVGVSQAEAILTGINKNEERLAKEAAKRPPDLDTTLASTGQQPTVRLAANIGTPTVMPTGHRNPAKAKRPSSRYTDPSSPLRT